MNSVLSNHIWGLPGIPYLLFPFGDPISRPEFSQGPSSSWGALCRAKLEIILASQLISG